MIETELRVDIDADLVGGESQQTAVTVFAPDRRVLGASPIVMFGWPGGGYCRRYFDLQLPGRSGYSQAEYHASRGDVFVACDHLGVGDSTVPEVALDHSQIAAVNAWTAARVLELLANGDVDAAIPRFSPAATIGMGQSYGGLLLVVLQAGHPTFHGVAVLGYSAFDTRVPTDVPDEELAARIAANTGLDHPYRRGFHFHDVPEEIVVEDLRGYPARADGHVPAWSSQYMPGGPNFSPERGPLGPGVITDEAAKIDVPVFIGNGETDVCPDPRAEPAAYRSSPDITTFVLPRSAHMHNFAGTRAQLWERLHAWAHGLPPR